MTNRVNRGRRRFLGAAAMTVADTHRLLEGGIGHNPPQEAPQAFAQAVIDVDKY